MISNIKNKMITKPYSNEPCFMLETFKLCYGYYEGVNCGITITLCDHFNLNQKKFQSIISICPYNENTAFPKRSFMNLNNSSS